MANIYNIGADCLLMLFRIISIVTWTLNIRPTNLWLGQVQSLVRRRDQDSSDCQATPTKNTRNIQSKNAIVRASVLTPPQSVQIYCQLIKVNAAAAAGLGGMVTRAFTRRVSRLNEFLWSSVVVVASDIRNRNCACAGGITRDYEWYGCFWVTMESGLTHIAKSVPDGRTIPLVVVAAGWIGRTKLIGRRHKRQCNRVCSIKIYANEATTMETPSYLCVPVPREASRFPLDGHLWREKELLMSDVWWLRVELIYSVDVQTELYENHLQFMREAMSA